MKTNFILLVFLLISSLSFGQILSTGNYASSLKLAFDSKTNQVTGYYEEHTGWNEELKTSQFSCIFYLVGTVKNNKAEISTYYLEAAPTEKIAGTLKITDNKNISIQLTEEHGGCWNVQHFIDGPVDFSLEKAVSGIQVRYAMAEKAYFHSDKYPSKKLKSYIIKRDIVFVDKIEGDWAYCTYYGKKATKGWIKVADLNSI